MVTPLPVQPYGWAPWLFNGAFLLVFPPLAERLFGRWLLALYLFPGVAGQAVNYFWRPDGGGSSTGVFGVMGALLLYVCRKRSEVPPQYFLFALLGLAGAVAVSFAHDGHGPAMLVGALLAAAVRSSPSRPPPPPLPESGIVRPYGTCPLSRPRRSAESAAIRPA